MDKTLLPCPFCGSSTEILEYVDIHSTEPQPEGYEIFCECGVSIMNKTKEEVIAAWNKRDSYGAAKIH